MIPNQSAPRWSHVLKCQADLADAGLATRILISRFRQEVAANPGAMPSKVAELHSYIEKNDFAQRDLALL
jgi:hypothetical protein